MSRDKSKHMPSNTEELTVQLARLEAKLDANIARVNEIADAVKTDIVDHEQRIRTIERLHDQLNPAEQAKKIADLMEFKKSEETRKKTGEGIARLTWLIITGVVGMSGVLAGIFLDH